VSRIGAGRRLVGALAVVAAAFVVPAPHAPVTEGASGHSAAVSSRATAAAAPGVAVAVRTPKPSRAGPPAPASTPAVLTRAAVRSGVAASASAPTRVRVVVPAGSRAPPSASSG
jgi:hypothetical protein